MKIKVKIRDIGKREPNIPFDPIFDDDLEDMMDDNRDIPEKPLEKLGPGPYSHPVDKPMDKEKLAEVTKDTMSQYSKDEKLQPFVVGSKKPNALKALLLDDKITLDELIEGLQRKAGNFSLNSESGDAYNDAATIIHKNRDAIIAGCQRPLRFKHNGDYWELLDKNGRELLIEDGSGMARYQRCDTKKHAESFADDLQMPCEFLED